MRAVVYRGVNDLRLEVLPVPRIGPNDLLVRVALCGVCPTDIKKIRFGTVPPPRVFGHETSGTIVKTGRNVGGWRVGDRVALHHHVPCLDCHACRHKAYAQCPVYQRTGITAGFEPAGGGYAEYVQVLPFVLPGVVRIPEVNSFLEGAMLEPVNTVLKGVNRLALIEGDTVIVAGQGPIGLMFTRVLALRGMRVWATDFLETRLKVARQFGAAAVFHPDDPGLPARIRRATNGRGIDAAIIAVPSDAVARQALGWIRGGGQVLLFAHTKRGTEAGLDLSRVCVDEKDLIGSYSSDFSLQQASAHLVFSGRLDVRKLVTHEFPLEATAQAIDRASNPTADALKIVVRVGAGSADL